LARTSVCSTASWCWSTSTANLSWNGTRPFYSGCATPISTGPDRMADIYFEDVEIGRTEEYGTITVTREAIIEFARAFDPQPFHLNDEAARQSLFGRLAASGWHTASMMMRLLVDHRIGRSASLG